MDDLWSFKYAQICLKRGSSSACLGIQNIVGWYGQIWACLGYQFMWAHGRNLWAQMDVKIRAKIWACTYVVWPRFRECFMDAHDTWRWVRKMGTPTMRRPCPGHVDTSIFAPPRPLNFSRASFASRAKFLKNFRKNIWKSIV